MERILKDNSCCDSSNKKRVKREVFAQHSMEGDFASRLNNSPMMIAQRKKLHSLFGGTAQLHEVGEEILQGKFETVQCAEEEGLPPSLQRKCKKCAEEDA